MDYQRCADLHNEILRRGYKGGAHTWPDPALKTWWEQEAPSQETASRLSPSLIEFLKRAYMPYRGGGPQSLFFYISWIPSAQDMLDDIFIRSLRDDYDLGSYVLLYRWVYTHSSESFGLVFNLQTSKAVFVANHLELLEIARYSQTWMPLETILAGYIDMIDDGKVVAIPNCDEETPGVPEWPIPSAPWILHIYTGSDVRKAALAMKRLLDAIDARIESNAINHDGGAGELETPATEYAYLPWNDPAALPANLVPKKTFAYRFLYSIRRFKVRFRYVAPGVRFPTLEEFLAQRAPVPAWQRAGQHSLRILHVEQPEEDSIKDKNNDREEKKEESKPLKITDRKYPGLYIEQVIPSSDFLFSNECRLELPFGIGANGWARQSNGQPLGYNIWAGEPVPADSTWDLYQSGNPTGWTDIRLVQIHKVLENWAERVESGDWDVDEQGVVGGSGKFREADTEEGWRKYWIPLSW
ncbi:hypothetical protein BJY04DRAFT_225191 [Aspergillus karnatakaensis]|uniref:uncharacterized protein n=1 Tax=Aspergillus karnatakaensis TaxID=1810916 RepID=UPI003CCDF976